LRSKGLTPDAKFAVPRKRKKRRRSLHEREKRGKPPKPGSSLGKSKSKEKKGGGGTSKLGLRALVDIEKRKEGVMGVRFIQRGGVGGKNLFGGIYRGGMKGAYSSGGLGLPGEGISRRKKGGRSPI